MLKKQKKMDSNFLIEALKYLGEEVLLHKVSPLFFVNQYQGGVLLRSGKYHKDLKHGWNFKLPVTDRFLTCTTTLETAFISNVNITTKDNKPCTVSASFEYRIEDCKKYLLDTNDAPTNIKDVGMGCIADSLIDTTWDDISKRKTMNEIKRTLNKELSTYGVLVTRFWFTDITITRVFTLFNQ